MSYMTCIYGHLSWFFLRVKISHNRVAGQALLDFFKGLLLYVTPLPFGVLLGELSEGCGDGRIIGNKSRDIDL